MLKIRKKALILAGILFILALGLRDIAANRLWVDYDEPTYVNAGLFMAVNTLAVKYTSQAYLEALPLLTSLLSVICYSSYVQKAAVKAEKQRKAHLWLLASAVFLGLTAASKYLYCVAGLAIALHFVLMIFLRKEGWQKIFVIFAWGLSALAVFFVFDPLLWPHPISRLLESVTFHLNYSQSVGVLAYKYTFYQPFRWLSVPFQYFDPKPESAFIIQLDWVIFGLALIGLYRTFKKHKIYFVWLVLGLIVLMLWSTKWPQYVLIVMTPYCLSAAEGLALLWEKARGLFKRAPAQ
jgi:hypothetical protein